MKKLGWFNKIVFVLNIVLAVLTFLAYILPFLAPKIFPILSALTLFLPLMLIFNLLFFTFWFIQFKKQMLLSALMLLLGITFINKFYRFYTSEIEKSENDFVVMSYNVRLFNLYEWIKIDDVDLRISNFIKEQNPDILCIQEYSEKNRTDFRVYQHQLTYLEGDKSSLGQAIFSKYPIVNKGKIEFPDSRNKAVFADVKRGKDTIRVYSIHLQSVNITPDIHEIDDNFQDGITQERSIKILQRISTAFRFQQQQAEILREHRNGCTYPVIICGDMNNSAFSYVYRILKGNLNDTFEKAGTGFGKTYSFRFYPARIDYIFADKIFDIKSHHSFPDFQNSDHFPVVSRMSFKSQD
ncbi:MAG TPA: endonuclease/exonuclease/phosphatase family protein [Flavobacterium sp.]|nr:endonuclease/exonuclease/phosphatase family protein [Flavobacterium sp.]